MTLTRSIHIAATSVIAGGLLAAGTAADAPHVYAIRGARIVSAAGPTIASGTVVVRGGLIDSVGADVAVPPDATVIDGAGLTVYPGLIDMGQTAAVAAPENPQPRNPRTREEVERWKRDAILNPAFEAAAHVKVDTTDLTKLASAGITAVLALPPGSIVKGRSALVTVVAPDDEPQIGAVADLRRGQIVVRSPVALHVDFGGRAAGDAYPASLMGVIAFVRQSFLDAQHYQLEWADADKRRPGAVRPPLDPALAALGPALEGRLPVAFEADLAREIRRALAMAREFKLSPVVTGGLEADQVADELKAAGAPVLVSLNYPTRPRTLAPDADEPLGVLRRRSGAPKVAGRLAQAGVPFAFQSDGLRDPKDFVKNAAKAVKEGLAPDAAIRALTIEAAKIAGIGDRLGSIEKGKIANLVVTEGDLFDEKMKIRHVLVDGRSVRIEAATEPAAGERRPRD